jgi:hypothetical protein
MKVETRDSTLINMREAEVEILRTNLISMRKQRDDWESAYYELRAEVKKSTGLLSQLPLHIVDRD